MIDIFLGLSKYLIIVIMALYTIESLVVFYYGNIDARKGTYVRQIIMIFLVHGVAFSTMALRKDDMNYWFLYGIQSVLIIVIVILFQMIYPKINKLLINNMCMLLVMGFIVLSRLSFNKAMKQFAIIIVSLIIAMIVLVCIRKIKILDRLTWVYAGVGITALATVLLVGAVTNGSNISYSILGVTFQPSEFVKILFVFFVASLLKNTDKFLNIALSAVIAGGHVLILVLSKDLGCALILYIVYFVMLYVATRKIYYLLIGIIAGALAAYVAYLLFGHVQIRVDVWLNPWVDVDKTGYQITQSLFAIGTGGWFGLGLLKGTPTSIPFVETDFVFSAIVEEMGVLVGLFVIIICFTTFARMLKIAIKLKTRFHQLIVVGLAITYGFQVFLTIGGGTKMIPLTGVTLPLISYGGSSMLSTLILFFIIQGLYINRKEELEKIDNNKRFKTQS